jgi:hypothetical protein
MGKKLQLNETSLKTSMGSGFVQTDELGLGSMLEHDN